MGRRKAPGLFKRGGIWHVDKRVRGRRICQSTRTADFGDAERFVARLIETDRQAHIYGVRPSRSFEQAAAKFVFENQHKRSLEKDIGLLKQLMPRIGHLPLERIQGGVLQPYVDARRQEGRSAGTINHGLKIVRRVLNLAAQEWMDEYGLTWLVSAPKVKLLPDTTKRPPYPLNWEEQTRLFQRLPITWRRWRSLPSTPGVAMVRSASCAGSGSSSCNR